MNLAINFIRNHPSLANFVLNWPLLVEFILNVYVPDRSKPQYVYDSSWDEDLNAYDEERFIARCNKDTLKSILNLTYRPQ